MGWTFCNTKVVEGGDGGWKKTRIAIEKTSAKAKKTRKKK
jgi:hypothetical protein